MNSNFERLQFYLFQKFSALFKDIASSAGLRVINLFIGEPKYFTLLFIQRVFIENLQGLVSYSVIAGSELLRSAIVVWFERCYGFARVDLAKEVLSVNGSREALFVFAQTVVDVSCSGALVVMFNFFYQIYEGAALLAGAASEFLNIGADVHFRLDFAQLSHVIWACVQLIYVCSPANLIGSVMTLEDWCMLFDLSDRYGFVIVLDECYSEIYFDEVHLLLGGLQVVQQLGRAGFACLVSFGSLSKRFNVPGMCFGYVVGDVVIIACYLFYRIYQGGAMNLVVQVASVAAWNEEMHVIENRRLYCDKFAEVIALLCDVAQVEMFDAAFYLWLLTLVVDIEFVRALQVDYNVTVLSGSYLVCDARGVNFGRDFVRIALVFSAIDCLEVAQCLCACLSTLCT